MSEATVEKPSLSGVERALRCAELAADKKGYDLKVLDITGISTIADFLVIISGQSDKQNQAICDHIRRELKKFGKVQEIEGETEGKWIVMDYSDVLVHIFHEEQRRRYDLDGLWSQAAVVELPAALAATDAANKASFAF
ncbi:ribosome silencing factor [Trichlorobacter ammonificans]|uniref:Ribosomal silencing factor RsfS n=1 Tax=Trichlorobacter ammonificans TaxID=2916410 RepID=A0ABN8HMX8_9BACT|nr:ribosome silencing factor [Trichlorobacter ammonificans]CAH2032702.1 Ribosomal silencing factor RsfS [Trichlorobacter ammonificans]